MRRRCAIVAPNLRLEIIQTKSRVWIEFQKLGPDTLASLSFQFFDPCISVIDS